MPSYLSPEEVLANALAPAQQAISNYGQSGIDFAKGQYLRQEEDKDALRQQNYRLAQIAATHSGEAKNQIALEQLRAKASLDLERARAEAALGLATHNKNLEYQNALDLGPLKQADELERISTQAEAYIGRLSAKEKDAEALDLAKNGIDKTAGETQDQYLARGHALRAQSAAGVLENVFQAKETSLRAKHEALIKQDAQRVAQETSAGTIRSFFENADPKDKAGVAAKMYASVKPGGTKPTLELAVQQYAADNPKRAPFVSQVYDQASASAAAAAGESNGSKLMTHLLGGIQGELDKNDIARANFLKTPAAATGYDYLLKKQAERAILPAPAAKLPGDSAAFINGVAAPGVTPGQMLSGAAAPASVSPTAKLTKSIAPGLPSANDVFGPGSSAEVQMSPSGAYRQVGYGPQTALEVLAAEIARERTSGGPKNAFGIHINPLDDAWHDTMASALGVKPEQIGSSILMRSPRNVLKRKMSEQDSSLGEKLSGLSRQELEHLAANVLMMHSPVPQVTQGQAVPSSQIMPQYLPFDLPPLGQPSPSYGGSVNPQQVLSP